MTLTAHKHFSFKTDYIGTIEICLAYVFMSENMCGCPCCYDKGG